MKKNFIQFYHLSTGLQWVDGKLIQGKKYSVEMCGSDSELWYDGRLGFTKIIQLAILYKIRMQNIHSDITGFKIYKNGRVIYSNVPTKD